MRPAGSPAKAKETGGFRPAPEGQQKVMPTVILHGRWYKLLCDALTSARVAHHVAVVEALRFGVVEFGREAARAAGEVRAALAARGTPIGPHDVLIAGQALARGMVLVTRDAGEFGRVPGRVVEGLEP